MNQKQKKILVNGCSHTRAHVPDDPTNKISWPNLLAYNTGHEVINIAEDGKANFQIVEEAIRFVINRSFTIDHVVIQLTDWTRLNFFRKQASGTWMPRDFLSQKSGVDVYVKIPAADNKDLHVKRLTGTPKQKIVEIGDRTLIHNIITCGTMVNSLSRLCREKGLGLTIINYYELGDCRGDDVWADIPDEDFLIINRVNGLYNHLCWLYDTPDTMHFEKSAHFYISGLVEDHIDRGQSIRVSDQNYDEIHNIQTPIFDYGDM